MYKPCKIREMITPAIHKKPVYTTVNGRDQKTYANAAKPNLRGKFKLKGSTDVTANGVTVYNESTTYMTWYKSDLAAGDALEINGALYLITGNPENTEMRGRYTVCTLERISGGAQNMAKAKKKAYSMNFEDMDVLGDEITKLGDIEILSKAIEAGLKESKKIFELELSYAIKQSPYNFEAGKGHSIGKTKEAIKNAAKQEIEWDGDVAQIGAGANMRIAPELIILARKGTPKQAPDKNIANVLSLKGRVGLAVDKVQKDAITEALERLKQ